MLHKTEAPAPPVQLVPLCRLLVLPRPSVVKKFQFQVTNEQSQDFVLVN